MTKRTTRVGVVILLGCTLSLSAAAQQPAAEKNVKALVVEIEDLLKEKKPSLGMLEIKRDRLQEQLANNAASLGADVVEEAEEALEEVDQEIEDTLNPDISKLIGGTKPMTAILFSNQDRNGFEVLKDPASGDSTVGIVNQNQSGDTGGILIAAEAPLMFPRIKTQGCARADRSTDGGDRACSRIPIGAWFGVNLKTGSGEEVSDVDLAAGISISLLTANRIEKMRQESGGEGMASARILLGVVYGEVASLGPKNAAESLQIGDPYPLGDSLPISKDKKISFAWGIGFRF